MTNQSARTFTATHEAQHVDQLRAERDRTDADIRADFIQRIDETRIARERAKATAVRGRWERDSAIAAINIAFSQASAAAAQEFDSLDYPNDKTFIEALDLEGATITVTIADLVATATVTVPTLTQES